MDSEKRIRMIENLSNIKICSSIVVNWSLTKPNTLFFSISVKPLVVQILTKEPRVSADKNYEVECRTSGSRPEPVITWWKGDKQIKKIAQNVSFVENKFPTISANAD